MIILTYIIAAGILLGLCIFIHELGHLLGGKMVGIKAKVFSIGYGKGILKKQIGDTTYQITPIPFGGYCQFYGEDPSEEREGKSYEFLSANPLKRVVVVLMGPLFNLFFGIILFFVMNLVGYTTETNRILIPDNMQTGEYISPAYSAGLRNGDRIIEINGTEITSFSEIQSSVIFSKGKNLSINAERGSKIYNFIVKPEKYSDKGHFAIGVLPYGEQIVLATILKDDVAEKTGFKEMDQVKSINGEPVTNPDEFTGIIKKNPGNTLDFSIIRSGNEMNISVVPRIREVLEIDQFESAAFKGEEFDITTDKIDLVKNSIRNKKLKINNILITSFDQFKKVLKENENKNISLANSGGTYYGKIKYEQYGFIGVGSAISPDMIHVRHGVFSSLFRAFVEPYNFIVMNLKGMGMLFSGQLDVRENLRGPIMIAKIAGDVAYYKGISAFILLMAKISIILMVMNLLPIPVVDGSFILFFLFEAIRGKPINQKILEKIQFVGVILLIGIGIFVVFNDLSVFPFFQKLFN